MENVPGAKDVSMNVFVEELFKHSEKIAVLTNNSDRMAELFNKFTNDVMNQFQELYKRIAMSEQRHAMGMGVGNGSAASPSSPSDSEPN